MAVPLRGAGRACGFRKILYWNRQRLLANVAFVGQQLTVFSSSPVPVLGSEIATTGVHFAMIHTVVYILCAPRDQIATTKQYPRVNLAAASATKFQRVWNAFDPL